MHDSRLRGMQAFTLVWAGQFISLTGSAMSMFGLTIWAYMLTGQATPLALVAFFNFGPTILFSPIAGVLVDRWNRKLVMALSDLGAGTVTLIILLIYLSGQLKIEHVYIGAIFAGIAQSFQFPSFSAAISSMLPKAQYGRAQGMMAIAEAGSGILAPVFAAALLKPIGLSGIMTFDVVTYGLAILSLFIVVIPQPAVTEAGRQGRGGFLKEAIFGFRYILARPGLFGLLMVFLWLNLTASANVTLLNPMILARTGSNEGILGSVQSVSAFGGIFGGLLLTAWGGPKRKIHGVLAGMAVGAVFGGVLMGLGRGPLIWAAAGLAGTLSFTVVNGSSQAIWMAKVAPDVQGRVFASRRLIAQIAGPLGLIIAGPLADRVFEPALTLVAGPLASHLSEPGLKSGGQLIGSLGGLFGTGPGAGIALLIVITGVLQLVTGLAGYLSRAVRDVESILPDHDTDAERAPEAPEVEVPVAV